MRWIRRVLAVLAGIIVLALVVLYGGSEWIIRQSRAVPLSKIAVPTDPASIAEGGRLAKVEGCRNCHGPEGRGAVMAQDAMLGRIASPSLARVAATHSDEEIERAVRHGVRKDGTTLFVMPSKAYRHIADDDMGRIIAWIRTLKPSDQDQLQTTSFGPLGRMLILNGAIPPSVQIGKVAEKTRPADTGRYFAEAVCQGCHLMQGQQPSDDGKQIVPGLLDVAPAYDVAAFHKLLKTGVPPSGRDLGLMKEVALVDFSAMTDAEIAAVHAYLKGEAAKLPPK